MPGAFPRLCVIRGRELVKSHHYPVNSEASRIYRRKMKKITEREKMAGMLSQDLAHRAVLACLFFAIAQTGCHSVKDGVEVVTCTETFNACGGDPTGTWDLASMCVEGGLPAAIDGAMATDWPSCANSTKSAHMTVAESQTFSVGTLEYQWTSTQGATVSYSAACMAEGAGTPNAGTCQLVGATYSMAGGTTGGCAWTGSSCNCNYTQVSSEHVSTTYTINGSTLVDQNGPDFEFCVSGGALSERVPIDSKHYQVLRLTRR